MLEKRRYQAYITDALMIIAESNAQAYGGRTMKERWVDAYIPKDTRTGAEIASDVIKRAGLLAKDGDAHGLDGSGGEAVTG